MTFDEILAQVLDLQQQRAELQRKAQLIMDPALLADFLHIAVS
jgi:hypothetical protein